ncbi:MAG: hypothetical protein ACRD8W_03425 [Nitrososphaeraceae archaeon]
MSTRYIEPPKKKVVTELPESLRRKRDACSKISRAYIFNKTTDKNVLETSILAQKYPTLVKDILLNVCRVKLAAPDTFELDDSGTLQQPNGKITEALVWVIRRNVMDPHNENTVVLRHCTIKEGTYSRPFARVEKNADGEVVKTEIAYWKHIFWIPFTKENVLKVLSDHNNQYRNLVCCYALERGEHWNDGKTYNVTNLEEFYSVPHETLVQSNRAGVLSQDFGGHIRYLKDQEEKRKRLEVEVAEYTGSRKSKK